MAINITLQDTIRYLQYPEQLAILSKLSAEEKRKLWDNLSEERKELIKHLTKLPPSPPEFYIQGHLPIWGKEMDKEGKTILGYSPTKGYSIISLEPDGEK